MKKYIIIPLISIFLWAGLAGVANAQQFQDYFNNWLDSKFDEQLVGGRTGDSGFNKQTISNVEYIVAESSATAVIPSSNGAQDLGSASYKWGTIYANSISGGGTLSGGTTNTIPIWSSATALTTTTLTYAGNALYPSATNTIALGTSSSWADLFLGSGAVIDFNSGDVKETHSANTLAWTGATSYRWDAPMRWTAGVALTAAQYEIGRNAASTNEMAYNVPGGTLHRFSVNDNTSFTIDTNSTNFPTEYELHFGDNEQAVLDWSNNTTDAEYLELLVSTSSRNFIFAEDPENWGHPVSTNPTFWIQSADTTNNQYINFTHDQTDGVISTGAGDLKLTPAVGLNLSGAVANTGSPALLTVTGGAHTTLTASTEASDVVFNLDRIVQFATGTIGSQRAFVIDSPVYAFSGTSTMNFAATLAVTGLPTVGTNANILNSVGFVAGALGGHSSAANIAVWLLTEVPGIANGVGAVTNRVGFSISGPDGGSTDVSMGNQTSTLQSIVGLNIDSYTISAASGLRTITGMLGASIAAPTISGNNVDVFQHFGLVVGDNYTINQANAGTMIADILTGGNTITLGRTTQLTPGLGVAGIIIDQNTVAQSGGAVTVDNAASLYIAGAPIASTSVTLSNNYALWVGAGGTRFDGRVIGGQGADATGTTTITLGADGNTFEVTGSSTINAIITTGWNNGSEITLGFSSTTLLKHNTAGSGTSAVMLLAGSADFSVTANDLITLKLMEIGGVQAWYEKARTAI